MSYRRISEEMDVTLPKIAPQGWMVGTSLNNKII